MAHDIIRKNIKGGKKILSLKKKCLLRPACSLKDVIYFPSNNNKMSKTVVA
jgi:hypothetical protein